MISINSGRFGGGGGLCGGCCCGVIGWSWVWVGRGEAWNEAGRIGGVGPPGKRPPSGVNCWCGGVLNCWWGYGVGFRA